MVPSGACYTVNEFIWLYLHVGPPVHYRLVPRGAQQLVSFALLPLSAASLLSSHGGGLLSPHFMSALIQTLQAGRWERVRLVFEDARMTQIGLRDQTAADARGSTCQLCSEGLQLPGHRKCKPGGAVKAFQDSW